MRQTPKHPKLLPLIFHRWSRRVRLKMAAGQPVHHKLFPYLHQSQI